MNLMYDFYQPYGVITIGIEPRIGLAEYVKKLQPAQIKRVR